ncbi:MAG: hypothetical protein WA484_10485 [Solirubrobacteraceae bacterium]
MVPKPRPSELIYTPPASKVGIEETRGSPRPWIFEREEARRHRRALALSRVRKLLGKLTLPHRTR